MRFGCRSSDLTLMALRRPSPFASIAVSRVAGSICAGSSAITCCGHPGHTAETRMGGGGGGGFAT